MGKAERPELADTVAGWSGGDGTDLVLERGSAVGRYLILELLATGGMGAVYAAYDPQLDRKVAVKLVLPGAASSVGRARMLREAQAIARLAHPNVVAVHDVGTRVDQVFVAMELVDGVTLRTWLHEAPRTTGEILEVFLQAGRGLAAAHKAGLVHRDFKPDNVLVGKDGRTRVVDFGLVREVDQEEEAADASTPVPLERALSLDLTLAGSVMGTPAYMAPEQFLRRAADARSDQYSFCVTLFEALSGVVPFAGGDLESTAEKVLSGVVPEVGGERKVPPPVRAALRRGLSVSPAARFPSMDALLAELGSDRGGRRRRMLAAVAALGVAGGALAAIAPHFAGADGPPPCTGGEQRLAGAWDAPRRAALVRSFAATGVPYAADSARAAARSLDRYAGDWVKSWRDSCEATRVHGEQSAGMQDLRAACLARHRSELEAFVDLLMDADERTVRRAAAAAQLLPPADECDDLEGLAAPVPPPRDQAARREVDAIRLVSARLSAMILAARYKEALPQADALLARARELGYRPLVAEAGALVGQLRSRTGDPAGGIAAYLDAAAAAIAGHDDLAVARVFTMLVQSAADAEEFARGHEWARLAAAALERVGNPPARRASLHHVTGYLLAAEGKTVAAAHEHERALALRERISPTSLETARSLTNLAHVYDELGRYREARAAGERTLAIQEAEHGPSHPDVAICLTNLGNIASDEGNPTEAEAYYRRALAIAEKAVEAGDDTSNLGNSYNNLGVAAFEQGRLDDALDFHRRALAVREAIGPDEPDVSTSLNNMANIENERGRCREALVLYRRALAIAEKKLGPDHPFAGDALSGISDCTGLLGQHAEAKASAERVLAIRQAGARPYEMAAAQLGLAKALWETGARQRALGLALTAQATFAGIPAARSALDDVGAWLRSRPRR